ncbi:MAG: hypothetical protein AAFQ27_09855, partial [Pseudomonadota bacterium]
LFARLPAPKLADSGFLALNVMLAVYIGASLVGGSMADVLTETAIASVAVVVARLAMMRWLPAIGIAVFLHGMYDAIVGPHTGVADWYPPLCAGFDFVVGVGLVVVLWRRTRAATD